MGIVGDERKTMRALIDLSEGWFFHLAFQSVLCRAIVQASTIFDKCTKYFLCRMFPGAFMASL